MANGTCPRCGKYGDMEDHGQTTRPYEAHVDGEPEWVVTCGEYDAYLHDLYGAPTAGERAVKAAMENETLRNGDAFEVWVRSEGDTSEGEPFVVEVEMRPTYHAMRLERCPGGCGRLVKEGRRCYDCRRSQAGN